MKTLTEQPVQHLATKRTYLCQAAFPLLAIMIVALTAGMPMSLVAQNNSSEKTESVIVQPRFDVTTLDNKFVLAHWSVPPTGNYANFTVERSSDGINFEAVGLLNGGTASDKTTNYSYIDEHPIYGTSYYRLKMTGTDQAVSKPLW